MVIPSPRERAEVRPDMRWARSHDCNAPPAYCAAQAGAAMIDDKHALVVGVANEQSIAWGVAKAFRDAGAELAITYLNVKAEPYVRGLAERVGACRSTSRLTSMRTHF